MYDCIVIGAGISGCSVAYYASQYKGKVLVLEKNNDVANETTKANSAIVHAGYDPEPNTLMAKYNVEGNCLIPELCKDLDVPCKNIGSLVVAFNESEVTTLHTIYDRGILNGVKGMRIVSGDELFELEPNLNPSAVAALYAPSASIMDPWQFTIALCEVSIQNGVEYKFESPVTKIEKVDDHFHVYCNDVVYTTKLVVNAAGVYCDEITGMVKTPDYKIIPNKGEYYLLDKNQGTKANHVIFQCPNEQGKGVLVAPTVHGNLIVGPTSENCESESKNTTTMGLSNVKSKALVSIPSIQFRENIRCFAGIRARSNHKDFIVGEDQDVPGFYEMAGMASPGLTSAPAIGKAIVEMFKDHDLLHEKKDTYVSTRNVVRFKDMDHEERKAYIKEHPLYGRIICRCETISEGEIVDAIHRCPGKVTIDAIKRRCNAGMGRCQGGFCGPRVQEIIARELGIDMQDVLQDHNGSVILFSRTKEDTHE